MASPEPIQRAWLSTIAEVPAHASAPPNVHEIALGAQRPSPVLLMDPALSYQPSACRMNMMMVSTVTAMMVNQVNAFHRRLLA